MRKIILVLCFLSAAYTTAQNGWGIQPPFTTKNLYLARQSAVYNLFLGSDSCTLFRSTDNGLNWTIVPLPDSLKRLSIRFVNGGNNNGWWAIGDSSFYARGDGVTVSSAIKIVTSPNQTRPRLKGFIRVQGIYNYAAEIAAGDSGLVYIRDGAVWRKDTAATRIAAGRNINSGSGFYFVGDDGMIMGADSIGYPRPNGERIRWRIISSGTNQKLNGVFQSSYIVMAVGAGGVIIKSSNSGVNWTVLPSPTTQELYNAYLGYAYLICGAGGTILKSTSSSYDNWFRQATPTTKDLYSIVSLGYQEYIAMGQDGIFLRTTNGGGPPIGVQQIGTEIPGDYSLSQNYPNPFNPQTKINFRVSEAGSVSLVVYDVTGKEIARLFNGKLSPGTYEAEWNGEDMPSGAYFYRISAGNFSSTRKMILLK